MKMAQGFIDWAAELRDEGEAKGEARKEKEAIEKVANYLMKQDKTLKKTKAREMAKSILR